MAMKYLVTGGTGFLGRSIVERLVKEGNSVTILDNESRGSFDKLNTEKSKIKFIKGDIRDKETVDKACSNIDAIIHLAYINGTENFYKKPDLVLDIAVKGMVNLLDSAIKRNIKEFYLASSSEVYNEPPVIPTPENVPVVVPDVLNPRFSYSGGKIISELLAIHNSKHFKKMIIFRPHNVYGPAMGYEHVMPQLILRMKDLKVKKGTDFQIQGDGKQSRSFIFIEDFTSALMLLIKKSKNLQIYNIGVDHETTVLELVSEIAKHLKMKIKVLEGPLAQGSPQRRCPDVTKLKSLGFVPKISLSEGLRKTIDWYISQ